MIDPKLKEWATPKQAEYIDAIIKHGSGSQAAKALGVKQQTLNGSMRGLKRRAARQGYSPEHNMEHTAPDGYHVKGVSTLYTGGQVRSQWVKTDIDKERQEELIRAAVAAMSEEVGRAKTVKPPKQKPDDLLNCHIITDYHLGMLAWGEETGGDWDTDIAEELLTKWFSTAITMTPEAETGIFAQLGDFLHFDGLAAITPTSGNLLDADTRFQLLVRTAIRVIRHVIQILLTKHNSVHVIMAEGNHDIAGSVWLRELFSAHYDTEPRVHVDLSPDPYYCYEHGETSIFFHHGHKKKPESLDDVFVAKFREVFGRTKHSYGHSGHLHHRFLKETNLMIMEQHRTLANPDAHSSRGGWLSGREANAITYHKSYGEVGRVTLTPEMCH